MYVIDAFMQQGGIDSRGFTSQAWVPGHCVWLAADVATVITDGAPLFWIVSGLS